MMQVTIQYPEVMKMVLFSTIQISECTTLQEVKEKIFASFWETFTKEFPRGKIHGSVDQVKLKVKNVKIKTDQELKEHLAKTSTFQAVFKAHPKTSATKVIRSDQD
jgi:Zn-dependent M16 (insulinase) family peptidase